MHHYAEGRAIADMVPESTFRASVDEVAAVWRDRWVELTGATALSVIVFVVVGVRHDEHWDR